MADEPWSHDFVEANGVRFHYVAAGDGPPLVLLHGFPEFWYTWHHLIPPLAERFRVLAPDMRGYNETSKPKTGYDVRTLSDDVVAFAAALGHSRFRLAGHDWGGAVAWVAAARRPDAVERLAILTAPHPAAMTRALRSSFAQLCHSWYMFAFQVPALPEWVIRRGGVGLFDRAIRRGMAHPERMTDDDVARFHEAMSRPGALEAALEYYRQAFRTAIREGRRA